jgi:hypothetical protein
MSTKNILTEMLFAAIIIIISIVLYEGAVSNYRNKTNCAVKTTSVIWRSGFRY